MSLRVTFASMANPLSGATEAKASLNRAIKFVGLDPKPGDLAMGRLKVR